jgi:hypothetical protein
LNTSTALVGLNWLSRISLAGSSPEPPAGSADQPHIRTWRLSTLDWAADIVDDPVTLQLFDQLRSDGAQWFGIVGKQKQHLQKNSPKLLSRI